MLFTDICFKMIDYMLMDSAMTLEEACRGVLRDKGFAPALIFIGYPGYLLMRHFNGKSLGSSFYRKE